jgi:Carboxypeptidase regulatory-like domain
MIKTLARSACLWFFLGSCLNAQNKVTKLRGSVRDAVTNDPVAGATVSASGDTAQQNEITDDKGFFRILIQGIAPGDLVRLRVEKPGYAVYDRQVVASEEIPLDVLLRRRTTATPPTGRRTVEPAAPADPIVAQYVEALKGSNAMIKLHALDVLVNYAPTDKAAMSAVIGAELDFDYRVRERAIEYVVQLKPTSKQALTNLLIDLRDPEPEVQAQALWALGRFPRDKELLAGFFRALGTPPSINLGVMYKLMGWGVEDPRLSEAIFYEVTRENAYAIEAMSKETPLSQEWISRLIAELRKGLNSPANFQKHGIIRVLLRGGGEPGHQALHQLLSASDPYQQSSLILSWLEVDHGANAEILKIVRVADITAELRKALSSTGEWGLVLEDEAPPLNKPDACRRGVRLRAAMGMLVLGLEPREDAWDVLAFDLDRGKDIGYREQACGNYAAAVAGFLGPSGAKPVIPLLVQDLPCFLRNPIVDEKIVEDTLAKVGDEDTIALLQRSAAQGMVICGNDSEDPGGKKKLASLIARINDRTDK